MQNPSAFPSGTIVESRPQHDPGANFHVTARTRPLHSGMTLRDYFAAKAMQGMIAHSDGEYDFTTRAPYAYAIADAMLAARQSKEPQS